jgi:ABC-type Na+ transport system ATPase subunit NatA
MGTMIVADNLHKAFDTRTGRIQAVANVGFRAEDGQITGLLGPNGAGKTTTMRMLYTLMTPTRAASASMASMPRAIRWRCVATWACCPMRVASTSA